MFIHGIATTGDSWKNMIEALTDKPYRVIVFDLLGFGNSPKPIDDWFKYNGEDHANSILHSLAKIGVKQDIVVVGHSMGCLIAVKIAKKRPDMVRQLVLYEPPFYEGIPDKKSYQLQKRATYRIFNKLLSSDPRNSKHFPKAKKILASRAGFEISEDTWVPFQRSIKNTVINQTAVEDIKSLDLPIQIIYGRYDRVVINDKNNLVFGGAAANISVSEISSGHNISASAAEYISKLLR